MKVLVTSLALISSMTLANSAAAGFYYDDFYGFHWSRTVNCSKGNYLQRTIDRARSGDTIRVRGTCSEDIFINKDRITLVGSKYYGGGVDGQITISGAQEVVIDNLSVTGSGSGVVVDENGAATIQYSKLEGNSGSGVFATNNAVATLRENVIKGNGAYGALATDGGNLRIRENNTIESDALNFNVGAAIGGFRQTSVHVTGGGNTITNTAFESPTGVPNSSSALGYAICIEHNSHFRQDQGPAKISGGILSFHLTGIDIRDADINGHIYADGLFSTVRLRDSKLVGGMSIAGGAVGNVRDTVDWTGDAYCNFNFLNPNQPSNGERIDCFPVVPPAPAAPAAP